MSGMAVSGIWSDSVDRCYAGVDPSQANRHYAGVAQSVERRSCKPLIQVQFLSLALSLYIIFYFLKGWFTMSTVNYNILVVHEDETQKLSCTAEEIFAATMAGIPIFLCAPLPGFEYGDDVENALEDVGYPDNDFAPTSTYYLGPCGWLKSDRKFFFTFGERTCNCETLKDYPVFTE